MAERFEVGGLIVVPTQKDLDKAHELLGGSVCGSTAYIEAVARQFAYEREAALERAVAAYYQGHYARGSREEIKSFKSDEKYIVLMFQLGYENCNTEINWAAAEARANLRPVPIPEYFTSPVMVIKPKVVSMKFDPPESFNPLTPPPTPPSP